MEKKPRASEKRILKALASVQSNKAIRGLYTKTMSLFSSGKIKNIKDIVNNKEISESIKKFSKKDSLVYRKLLEPVGFPKIAVSDVTGKKVMTFAAARRRKIDDLKSGYDHFFNIEEDEKKILDVMKEHIDFLGKESFFQKAHTDAKANRILTRDETSMNFYMEYAANYGVDFNHLTMLSQGGTQRGSMQRSYLGRMFFYRYRPQTPRVSYDFYPLVFVLNQTPDYFEGINFHNMFYKDRALILGNMYSHLNNLNYDKTTRLLFDSFSRTVKTSKEFVLAKASFRRYKYKDVMSKFIEVHPFDWEIATMVHTEKFFNVFHSKEPSKQNWLNTRIKSKT
jgi:hypothetical protein